MRYGRSLALLAMTVTAAACHLGPSGPTPLGAGPGALALITAAKPVPMPAIASEVLSPNIGDRTTGAPTCIVLHHTATTADANSTARYFATPASKVSAHFVVDRTGYIVRCVKDEKLAHHAGVSEFHGVSDVNQFSLGIEISNVGDHVEPYPKAQVDAVVRLTAALASKYRIPVANVTRHRDIALPQGRKQDTSDTLDVAYVGRAVQALLNGKPMPAYSPTLTPAGYDPHQQTYRVQAGDTLAQIADDVFDTPAMADAIANLNPHAAMKAGTSLRLPTVYPL